MQALLALPKPGVFRRMRCRIPDSRMLGPLLVVEWIHSYKYFCIRDQIMSCLWTETDIRFTVPSALDISLKSLVTWALIILQSRFSSAVTPLARSCFSQHPIKTMKRFLVSLCLWQRHTFAPENTCCSRKINWISRILEQPSDKGRQGHSHTGPVT